MPSADNTTKLNLAGEGKRFNTNVNGILNWYISGNYFSNSYPKGITLTLAPHKGECRYEGLKYASTPLPPQSGSAGLGWKGVEYHPLIPAAPL